MSATKRKHSITVRLSSEEQAQLDELADQLDLDKSATMRHALAQMVSAPALPKAGSFSPLDTQTFIPIRLQGTSDDR